MVWEVSQVVIQFKEKEKPPERRSLARSPLFFPPLLPFSPERERTTGEIPRNKVRESKSQLHRQHHIAGQHDRIPKGNHIRLISFMAGIDESGAAEGEPPRLGRTPKEGERILAPTRRPDGTFRKPIRIRAGYTPPDEVAIYQSKGARMKKSAEADPPPGYDPVLDAKPKTKSAKRNERKKEKKLQQAALVACDGKGKSLDAGEDQNMESQRDSHLIPSTKQAEQLESVTCEMSKLSVLSTHSMVAKDKLLGGLNPDPRQSSNPESSPAIILDKKIRALKKKVYFKATDPFSERWQSAWVITAFWDILAFALLCVICYLWAPSQSSQRYAYSEDIGEDTDEEVQTLTKHLSEGDIGLAKTGRRDGNMRTTDAFTLEDELEEDKRE